MSRSIAFLGCGAMNEAILAGLLEAGTPSSEVVVTVRRSERAAELAIRYPGLTAMALQDEPESNRQASEGAAVVVLGVEPAGIAGLVREISGSLAPETVVVSVAAAVTLAQLEAGLPPGQAAVRTLPNTPTKLGRGVVSVSPGSHCGPGQLEKAKRIFMGAGTVVEVPEEQVNAVSAVSGSGPAYAYYLAEAMAAAGVELGLDPELSALLARETVVGAGLMLGLPGADASVLRAAMAGPDSITVRALAVFDEQGIPGIIAAGARATVDRSAWITHELGKAGRP